MYKEYKKDRLLKQTEVEAATNNTQKAGIVNTAFQSDDEKVGTNVGDKRISNMIKDRSDRRSVDVTAHNEHHRPSIAELNIAQTVKCTSKI